MTNSSVSLRINSGVTGYDGVTPALLVRATGEFPSNWSMRRQLQPKLRFELVVHQARRWASYAHADMKLVQVHLARCASPGMRGDWFRSLWCRVGRPAVPKDRIGLAQMEMTIDVKASSLVKWTQSLLRW